MTDATPALELAHELASLLDSHKAEEIRLLDVSDLHGLIDCFVIATARGAKHARLLGEEALRHVKQRGVGPWHLEAAEDWICADFSDVVVHVFTPEARDYYDLEHLWADARRVAWTPTAA